MQSLTPEPSAETRSVMNTLTKMVKSEGIFRPVRGMSAVVIGAGPAHALYFSCYEKVKSVLLAKLSPSYNNLAYGMYSVLI